eukprot:4665592-Lingulodinium_polyedra.AAC.1
MSPSGSPALVPRMAVAGSATPCTVNQATLARSIAVGAVTTSMTSWMVTLRPKRCRASRQASSS